jgi:hypothetical protein
VLDQDTFWEFDAKAILNLIPNQDQEDWLA